MTLLVSDFAHSLQNPRTVLTAPFRRFLTEASQSLNRINRLSSPKPSIPQDLIDPSSSLIHRLDEVKGVIMSN